MMKRMDILSLLIVILIMVIMPTAIMADVATKAKGTTDTKYSITYTRKTIKVGKSFKQSIKKNGKSVKSKKIRWKISNSSIAEITNKNKYSVQIVGKKVGITTLEAVYKGKTYKCRLKVVQTSDKTNNQEENSKENPSLNTSSVTLYYIDEYAKSYINPDASHVSSYQFVVSGTKQEVRSWDVEGDVAAGNRIRVSDSGVVSMIGGYSYGDVPIKCRVSATLSDGTKLYEDVTGIYEVTEYVKDKITDFRSTYITENMTEYQKMDAVARYLSTEYDYQLYQENWLKMIVTGGGDCMASRVAVMMICRELGLHAVACRNLDDHGETVVQADGKVYLVTTGYGGPKPREYDIRELTKVQFDSISQRNNLDPKYFGY